MAQETNTHKSKNISNFFVVTLVTIAAIVVLVVIATKVAAIG
jgi:hypothetical protein